jgi:virginiamycin B lyase
MRRLALVLLLAVALPAYAAEPEVHEFSLPGGTHPHDVAPAPDGGVWYTAQRLGALGYLDPATGRTRAILLGKGSAPHGVIVGPDGAAWVTDGGQNAILRVDPKTEEVRAFPLPIHADVNLNTATFDRKGRLWFTGQAGYYGRVDVSTGKVEVFDAPKGKGPYGITTTPDGAVFYASLAGSYVGRVDLDSGKATVLDPPTPRQGARRVWADSKGRVWVSEWNVGRVAAYDPVSATWREWRLPGDRPHAYGIFVDDHDKVWLSDFGGDAILRFDPETEAFTPFKLPTADAQVRQIMGRPGEVWMAESATDKLAVLCDPCAFREGH